VDRYKNIELPCKEIGEEKGVQIILPLCELLIPGKERVAMRASDAFNAFFLAQFVQHAACATIGIGDIDALESVVARLMDGLLNARYNSIGIIVPMGGKAGKIYVRQAICFTYRQNFAGNGATCNDAHPGNISNLVCILFHGDVSS